MCALICFLQIRETLTFERVLFYSLYVILKLFMGKEDYSLEINIILEQGYHLLERFLTTYSNNSTLVKIQRHIQQQNTCKYICISNATKLVMLVPA